MRKSIGILLLLALCLGVPAAAEIYRWTDESGTVRMTQDLNRIPPAHREDARKGAKAWARKHPKTPKTESVAKATTAPEPKTYRIPVERAGTGMMVRVRLNQHVIAPFLIDTGATDVVIPRSVADQLHLRIDDDTRTKVYSTANGMIEQPVVMLRSVDLGGARVENVSASISDSMERGLLGLSYFNRFNYNIDAANGIVTLTHNDLEERGLIRGGRSEAQWRSEFTNLRMRMTQLEMIEARARQSGVGNKFDKENRRLARQLEELELEAHRARVPASWRD